MEQPTKRLTRSTTNKMIGGVCGGLAEYFNLDATLIRLLFVILVFAPGPGFLIYIVLWLIIPPDTAYLEKPKNDRMV
jgi:phage shock protein PspC (stress-responsive transcriptional regulator)